MGSTATDETTAGAVQEQVDARRRWVEAARNAPRLVRWLSLGVVVGNVAVLLGGVIVRLTGSGLGCPTWPKCTDASYNNTEALGVHGYIEFGNRLFGIVLGVLVGLTIIVVLAQLPRRRPLILLAVLQFFGFVAQAVVGGITVLTGLNPWTVSAHFLVSVGLIFFAYALWHRAGEGDGPRDWLVPTAGRWTARAITLAALATIMVGTVVTGSGPHSGDGDAPRTGFDPALISQLHADLVFLLIGLTVAGLLAFTALRGPVPVRRAIAVLLGVELVQGVIGYVQYFTHLPVVLVGLHVVGAALLWVAATRVVFVIRKRPRVG